jgi:hypothetical protein
MTSFDFDVILLEYHSDANRLKVDELLGDFLHRHLHPGTLKFLHRRLFQAAASGKAGTPGASP